MKPIAVVLLVTALVSSSPVRADECGDAVTDYNSVLAHLQDATQRFSNCVAGSLGVNNCSGEFSRLRSAYGEFAAAVVIYTRQCR